MRKKKTDKWAELSGLKDVEKLLAEAALGHQTDISRGETRVSSAVSLVNIYPLLPVICGKQTDMEHKVHRHEQMIKS